MIVALNNKSNLPKDDYLKYLMKIEQLQTSSKLILCPTFLNIGLTSTNICLGAQNVSKTEEGAYTGEITAHQLKSYNVEYCLIGHSERRYNQKEDLTDISAKMKRLLEEEITPILCIGETKETRDSDKVAEVLKEEIITAIATIPKNKYNKIIIAYEPIWAIGTGKIPTLSEIEEVFSFIKKILPDSKLLYGGSVNEKNIDTLKRCSLIDGYLLGGLSLKLSELKIFLNKLDN